MDLETRKVGDLQAFREDRADILEMREDAFGSDVALATENLIAIHGEAIKEHPLFLSRGLDKPVHQRFEGIELTLVNFEVWVETAAGGE
jgi:hypothetical protein